MKILFDNYSYKTINSKEEFSLFYEKNRVSIFENDVDINCSNFLNDTEIENQKILAQNMGHPYSLTLGIYYFNELIGWSYGWQIDRSTYYMCNTGIIKEHQNKGIYKKLLFEILNILKDKGFQVVYSRHKSSNNNVIVPKLQAGFFISKMEIDINFGILVHLSYFFNEKNRKALQFWTGQYRPDEEFKKYINGL